METVHTLASLRARVELTQDLAADLLGVTRPTLAKYEANSSKIPADLLDRAADLYGIPITEIYIGEAKKLADAIRASYLLGESVEGHLKRAAKIAANMTPRA